MIGGTTVSNFYMLECEVKKLHKEIELDKKLINEDITIVRNLEHKLEEINHLTIHAGCMGNNDCQWCKIQKILKENN